LCLSYFHATPRQYTQPFWVQVEGPVETAVPMVGGQAQAAEAAEAAALATSATLRAPPWEHLTTLESFRESLSKEVFSMISIATSLLQILSTPPLDLPPGQQHWRAGT